MTKYICSNCGELSDKMGNNSGIGCLTTFVVFILIILLFINPIICGFFFILCIILSCLIERNESNVCQYCKARNCMLPIDSPKGEVLFNKYYEIKEE